MEDLNFRPKKTKDEFHNNYKLHDLAEIHGKNLLTQWGFDFKEFGKDNRYKKLWEKGKDKPDLLIEFNGAEALVDWKAKSTERYMVNKRAIDSYENWGKSLNLPVLIFFFVFDEEGNILDRRITNIFRDNYSSKKIKAWDKNEVIDFDAELAELTKPNLLKALYDK